MNKDQGRSGPASRPRKDESAEKIKKFKNPQEGVSDREEPDAVGAADAPPSVEEAEGAAVKRERGQGGGRRGQGRRGAPKRQESEQPSEFVEKVIAIRRITKVTKGGKKLSFSALVVVGDMKGRVGYSHSKAREVAIAIRKALNLAKRSMIKIPLQGTTIPHEIIGQCGGASVLLKPAAAGTGIIAAGPVRAVCDGAGIHNILTKCHRSNNPINVVKATFDGLTRLKVAPVVVQAAT